MGCYICHTLCVVCVCVFMRPSQIIMRLIAAHIAMLDLLAILLAAHIDVLDLS